jgi:DNA-binding response OmpR family regulator
MVLNYEKMLLQIAHHDEAINLPLKEARLLKLFMEHPNECLTREQIKHEVWGNIAISGRTIDTYISKLRRYLEYGGAIIDSVYRGGYILRDTADHR